MSNLFSLIKVNLIETFDIRKFKENKTKSVSFLTFFLLMGLFFLFLSTIYNFSLVYTMIEEEVALFNSTFLMATVTSFLCFSTSMFRIKSIFIGKDHDILSSMPIAKKDIISSKIIILYFTELLYSLGVLFPNSIIVGIYANNLLYIPIILCISFLLPIIPIAFACVASMFMTFVADRFKLSNIINIILYLCLFIFIFYFSFSMSEGSNLVRNINKIIWINPSIFLVKLTFENNYLYLFLFIIINIIVLVGIILFIALSYDKLHDLVTSINSDVKYVRKQLSVKGQLKALTKNEFKRFFSSKIYFINCFASVLCSLVIAGSIAYLFSDYSTIEGVEEIIDYVKRYSFLFSLLIIFGLGITSPSASSISIEGNNFWMLKSYPIDNKKLIYSKLIVSISILGIGAILSSLLIIILVKPTIYSAVILIIISLLYSLFVSILGLIININHPKFMWKNESEIVKNSASIIITMFIDFAFTFIYGAILISLSIVNIYLGSLIGLGILIITVIVLYLLLIKKFSKKLESIEI